jgi:hypothetical protein
VWSSVDLDDLEEKLIERARRRQASDPGVAPRVLNRVRGRNGPPSRSTRPHWLHWSPPVHDQAVMLQQDGVEGVL